MSQIFLNGITVEQLAEAILKLQLHKHVAEPTSSESDLITRKQACSLLGINLSTLWKHTKSGKLHSFGIGNRVFYSRKQVLSAVKPINH